MAEFLAKQFSKIDKRFNQSDARFDSLDNRLARVEVGNEENAHQIQVLAEGISGVGQSLERFRKEVAGEIRAQGDRIEGLAVRMDRWEVRSL